MRVVDDSFWLTRCGVLVDLTIGFWRAKTVLTHRDLGLPEPKTPQEKAAFRELMTLGTRNLMPAEIIERLNSNDSGARKCLKEHAYRTRWGHWVDLGRYPRWKTLNQEFARTHLEIRDEVCAPKKWIEIRQWCDNRYAVAAHNAYDRLARVAPSVLKAEDGHRLTRDEFVHQYVTRALLKMPTREQVYASFAYTVQLSYIPLPSMLARDIAEKERVEAARLLERTAENAILHGERTRQLSEMDNDVTANAAANSPSVVQEFVRDLQMQCVSSVLAKIESVQQSVEKNDNALVGKSATQLKNALASYRAMNLTGHPRLDEKVARLAEMMGSAPDKRQLSVIVAMLDEIAAIAKQTLAALKRSAA